MKRRNLLNLLLVFTLLLFSLQVFADVNDDLSEVDNVLNDLKTTAENMEDSITIEITDRSADFPEYATAVGAHLGRIKTATANYKETLENIRTFVKTQLEQVYSQLAALEKKQKENPSKQMDKLIKLKEKRIEDIKKTLAEQTNNSYQKALQQLISLNNHLTFPVKKTFRFDHIGRTFITSLPCLMVFGIGFVICSVDFYLTGENDEARHLLDIDRVHTDSVIGDDGGIFKLKDNFGNVVDGGIELGDHRLEKRFAKKMFNDCATAGCTFFLAEDYKHWVQEASKLNRNIRLIKGVKLKKLPGVSGARKMKRGLNRLADLAAEDLPEAVFE